MTGVPHIQVEGDARARGRQYGELARERIAASIHAYEEVFQAYAGWGWQTVRDEAARYESPIARVGPKYIEEMRGIAEGASVDFEDVLAINVRTEVMFAAKARAAAEVSAIDGCSAFAVLPQASSNDHTLIGQNWDWLLHCYDTVIVLEARQPDGPNYVTVVEAGLLAKAGMNSAGIGLVTNALVTDADRGEPAIPYHVMLRAVLDCENLSDALAAMQQAPRSSSANYLIAHRDGLAANVEAAPGDFGQLYLVFPENGVLLHTNHFISPTFRDRDVSLWVMPDSPFRLNRLRTAVAAAMPRLSLQTFEGLLSDHANHPYGVCCHPDPRLDPLDQAATIVSVLMDLDEKAMWLADSHPCMSQYRRIDYSTLLSKPSFFQTP